jgi:hypothetical protein
MRKVLALFIALVSALGMMLFTSGSASASGEWLGCRIAPGSEFNFYNHCYNTRGPDANHYYSVAFMVQNESVASTYSWVRPSGAIFGGCTSTDNWCSLKVYAPSYIEKDFYVSVTITQGAYSNTLYSDGHIYWEGGGSGCTLQYCP